MVKRQKSRAMVILIVVPPQKIAQRFGISNPLPAQRFGISNPLPAQRFGISNPLPAQRFGNSNPR